MRKTLKVLVCVVYAAAPMVVCPVARAADVAVPAAAVKAVVPETNNLVEVCFVLDTTGSMSGLIDGAKKKIWTIANSVVAADSKASIRFALVAYRDRGDSYVTKIVELTDDLDRIFAELQSFEAGGGGDTPESVNQALAEAVNKLDWSSDGQARKFIFLVGDCPPHMDYSDDVKYPRTCETAVRKNIIINTVQCGDDPSTTEIWREIARRSEGSFVALEQSGGMVVIDAPQDKEIAELSVEIGKLSIPYGSERQQQEVMMKNEAAATAPASVSADRAAFNAASGKAIQGRGDLVSDWREKTIDLDKIDANELPVEMRKMTPEQRVAHLKKQAEDRDKLSARVNELSQARAAYIAEESRKRGTTPDAFDAKVAEIIEEQMQPEK
jgi:Mg-chelatase subunit ChlD